MKFGTGSNNELTQKYEKVKVQNDISTSTHMYKLVMCLSTNGERFCLVKTTELLLQNLYFSLINVELYNSSSKHKYQITLLPE